MRLKMPFVCLFFVATFLAPFSVHAQSSNPQQSLNQYISDLQKNPNDYALREKIIKIVQGMKPAPIVPDEAQKYMDRGIAAVESAKTAEDFKDAVSEFKKAVNAAPWIGNGYRNLGIAQDKAGQYDDALNSLRLYLLTNPPPSDEALTKSLINKIEYRMEKAAKESSPEAMAEKKQKEYEAWLRKIDGGQWVYVENRELCADSYIEVHGREIQIGWILTRPYAPCVTPNPYLGKAGAQFQGMIEGKTYIFSFKGGTYSGTISEDGEIISQTTRLDGEKRIPTVVFRRVKDPKWTIWNRF